jgi:hypothetical protein
MIKTYDLYDGLGPRGFQMILLLKQLIKVLPREVPIT